MCFSCASNWKIYCQKKKKKAIEKFRQACGYRSHLVTVKQSPAGLNRRATDESQAGTTYQLIFWQAIKKQIIKSERLREDVGPHTVHTPTWQKVVLFAEKSWTYGFIYFLKCRHTFTILLVGKDCYCFWEKKEQIKEHTQQLLLEKK